MKRLILAICLSLMASIAYAGPNMGYYVSDPNNIEGDLSVTGDVTINGNIDITELTNSSVLFINSTGQLIEDTDNFVFDDVNNRLGIGTSTPTKELDVNGEATFWNSVGPYGELFFHNPAASPLQIASDVAFSNVTGLTNSISSFATLDGANGTITLVKPGVYNLKSSQSFTSGANVKIQHIFSKNGVLLPVCHSHRKVSANDVGNSGIACLIEGNVGDVYRLMVNTPSSQTVSYDHVGWHIKR